MNEILINLACVVGSLAVFLAAVGVVRFPDFFTRAHAATKASAFGLALLLLAFVLAFPQANVVFKAVFAVIALFLTLPVASQALADAVNRNQEDPLSDDENSSD
jgi:multicomponent Na+:H+ antiporter subunit G